MLRKFALAAGLAASLSGCHFFLAPAVVAVTSGLGAAASVESIVKDVLEIDTSYHALFGVPPHGPPPAAIQ